METFLGTIFPGRTKLVFAVDYFYPLRKKRKKSLEFQKDIITRASPPACLDKTCVAVSQSRFLLCDATRITAPNVPVLKIILSRSPSLGLNPEEGSFGSREFVFAIQAREHFVMICTDGEKVLMRPGGHIYTPTFAHLHPPTFRPSQELTVETGLKVISQVDSWPRDHRSYF